MMHPGAKPDNFLARAMANAGGIMDELEEELGDSLENLATRTVTSEFRLFGGDY
jgi:hypothetical protein